MIAALIARTETQFENIDDFEISILLRHLTLLIDNYNSMNMQIATRRKHQSLQLCKTPTLAFRFILIYYE